MVSKFKQQARITDDYPMNIFNVCSRLENVKIGCVNFATEDLRGMVCIADNANENHVILLNGNKSKEEQNYHGFHELLHIITTNEPGTTIQCFEKVKPNQDPYIEWLANEGAAEFTVPYRKLLPMIKAEYNDMIVDCGTYNFCEEKSVVFGVSPVVMQNRINSLKYEIYQYINGVPIEQIEILSNTQLHKRGIQVKSLNDLEQERLLKMWFGEPNQITAEVRASAAI